LEVDVPFYSQAHIVPYEEPPRKKALAEVAIMNQLAMQKVAEGKFAVVGHEELAIINEAILVDKKERDEKKEPMKLPMEEGRWRLCIDARPANDLKVDEHRKSLTVDTMMLKAKVKEKVKFKQSQEGALRRLERVPISMRRWKARIDLKDAFYSVSISSGLQQLFGFRIDGKKYKCLRLPMGWYLAAQLFQSCMNIVVDSIKKAVRCEVLCQQDDIILLGPSRLIVNEDFAKAVEVVKSYLFDVNADKSSEASEQAVFCGLLVKHDGYIVPKPQRSKIVTATAESAAMLCETIASKEQMQSVLRSWLGQAKFYSKWIPPSVRATMHETQELLRKTDETPLNQQKKQLQAFIRVFVEWWVREPAGLLAEDDAYALTVLLVDANQNSWAGCILRVMKNGPDSVPMGIREVLETNVDKLGLTQEEVKTAWLAPVRNDGMRWSPTERAKSSTWRERIGLLKLVERNKEVIGGDIVIITDNENVQKTWRQVESVPAALIPGFERLTAWQPHIIHLKRGKELMQWVDGTARWLEEKVLSKDDVEVMMAGKRPRSRSQPSSSNQQRPRYTAEEYAPEGRPRRKVVVGEPPPTEAEIFRQMSRPVSVRQTPSLRRETEFEGVDTRDTHPEGVPVPSEDSQSLTPEASAIHELSGTENASEVEDVELFHVNALELHQDLSKWSSLYQEGEEQTTDAGKQCIPRVIAHKVLQHFHALGHPRKAGMKVMLQNWNVAVDDHILDEVLARCRICAVCRPEHAPPSGSLYKGSHPWDIVYVDLTEMKFGGQTFVIAVAEDAFTGFVHATDLRRLRAPGRSTDQNTASQISIWFLEMFAIFGRPNILAADNATYFNSREVSQVLKWFGVNRWYSITKRPQSNGIVEKAVGLVKLGVRMGLEQHRGWQVDTRLKLQVALTEALVGVNITRGADRALLKQGYAVFANRPIPDKVEGRSVLKVGARVLVKEDEPGLDVLYRDRGWKVSARSGNTYRLKDAEGRLIPRLYKRQFLRPILPEYSADLGMSMM
jgi:transposase InsO family protein